MPEVQGASSEYHFLQAEEAALGLGRMAAAEGEGWAADVRIGVYKVLVSRSGQHQRHSALRLAAAVLELAQPQWLLGPIQPVTPRSNLHISSA